MKIGRIIGKITGEKKRREAVSRGGVGQRSKREARAELPPRDYSVYIMSLREAAVGSREAGAPGPANRLKMTAMQKPMEKRLKNREIILKGR